MASAQFLLLAASLLDEVDGGYVSDALLSKLHVVFGPMLLSALQLVDRREVVRVKVGARHIVQVTASSGPPYTLYLDLPSSPSPQLSNKASEQELEAARLQNDARLVDDAHKLQRMYCPCVGYAYNSLAGERTVLCKHLLAVLLAHRLGRLVETHVGLRAVTGLVGVG